MDQNTETSSPFVTASQLKSLVNKSVVVAGKVLSVSNGNVTLDSGDGGNITVKRSQPSVVSVDPNTTVLVRGVVNADFTLSESTAFPLTVLGDKFGKFLDLDGELSASPATALPFYLWPWFAVVVFLYANLCSVTFPLVAHMAPPSDMNLYNEAAVVTSNMQYVHMFN